MRAFPDAEKGAKQSSEIVPSKPVSQFRSPPGARIPRFIKPWRGEEEEEEEEDGRGWEPWNPRPRILDGWIFREPNRIK